MIFRAIAATLLLVTPAVAQQPVTESVDVNLVLIDATVTDRDGNPILGLGAEDFVVTEGGVPQKIESVDYFTTRRMLDQPESKAEFKVDRVREERHLIFFFDKPDEYGSEQIADMQLARQAAREFVDKQMVAGDRIAIVGHDVRLKVYSDFTSDKKQLLRAIDQAISFGTGRTGDNGEILSNLDDSRMMNHTGRIYDALATLGDAVRPIRGRKVMIMFSHGIGDLSLTNPNRLERDTHLLERAVASLNRSNVSVHTLNLHRGGAFLPTEEYLSRIADETNGTYQRNLVRFEPAIRRINKENAGYYLIAYRPTTRGEGFQRVEVKLRNPEFRVSARSGYSR